MENQQIKAFKVNIEPSRPSPSCCYLNKNSAFLRATVGGGIGCLTLISNMTQQTIFNYK